MNNKRQTISIIAITVVSCIVMAIVDGVIQPGYAVKSLIKIVLFLALPIIYSHFDRELSVKKLFKIKRGGLVTALCLGVAIYALITGGYLVLRNIFDFSAITGVVNNTLGVDKDNFVAVSLYISFVNSLLEEFFFRGFAFLSLRRAKGRCFAYVFSSLAFSLYHVAMMIGWFSLPLFLLMLSGLFAGGTIFNYLNEKSESVYTSWLVHMFANFGINTVGFMLFGII